mmetsp:Transcript_6944/g.22875  ORF Transcript_6944/g.22875 Transcript_6944/m.22875 type:complete len:226 (+) Transcript_6944:625-1302(+)
MLPFTTALGPNLSSKAPFSSNFLASCSPKAGFADIHTPPPSCSSSSHRSNRQMYSHLGVPNFPSVFSSTLGTFDAKMAAPLRNFPPESMFGTCVTATLFVVLTMTSATYGDLFRTDVRCTTVQRTSGPKSINGSPDTCAGSASCFVVFARAPAARFLFTGMARRASATSEARATRMLALTNMFHTRLFEATLRYYSRQTLKLVRVRRQSSVTDVSSLLYKQRYQR